MLPTSIGEHFYAKCVVFKDAAVQRVEQFNALPFPALGRAEALYSKLRNQWRIVGAQNSKDLYLPPKDNGCTIV